jgi:hypothetical protein
MVLSCPFIEEKNRRDEEQFWKDFERSRPRILGVLLDAVSAALASHDSIKLEKKPRMADFAVWASAAMNKLGFTVEEFMEAYTRNRKESSEAAVESSRVASSISSFMEDRTKWIGTARELLQELDAAVSEECRNQKSWPKSARGLTGILTRLAPALRSAGIVVTRLPREVGRRPIQLENRGAKPSQSSQPSPGEQNEQDSSDTARDGTCPHDGGRNSADFQSSHAEPADGAGRDGVTECDEEKHDFLTSGTRIEGPEHGVPSAHPGPASKSRAATAVIPKIKEEL